MHDSPWAGSISLCGLAVVASLAFGPSLPAASSSRLHRLVLVGLIAGSGAVLVYAGYWHADRTLLEERYPHVVGWTAATTVLFVAVGGVSLYVGSRQVRTAELIDAVHLAASVGITTGLLAGTVHARAVDEAERVASARARAETLDARRAREELFNDLLRHYVRNGVNVISGYADRLRSAVPSGHRDSVNVVDRRARSMAALVDHVDSILAVPAEPAAPTELELRPAIESATGALGEEPCVRVAAPDPPYVVRASGTLDESLRLLFDALESVAESGGEIAVACESTPSTVTVSIAASPVTHSGPIAASLFEPISDAGLQFYLARRLVDDYGELRLADRNDDALRFELALERAG